MIPKIIHYCWFGRGALPEDARKCISSWKKYLPEYEIKEWNEDTFNVNLYPYTKEALEARKFAFVTDVVRLYAIYHEGGIYMDTDVEVLKPLDRFLVHEAFSGFESSNCIPTGIMAAEKGSHWAKEMLDYYEGKHFVMSDGSLDFTTNVEIITKLMKPYGVVLNNSFQTIGGLTLYPSDYFCPKSPVTGEIELTQNSHCIHHFRGSWASPLQKRLTATKKVLYKIFGTKFINGMIETMNLRRLKKKIIRK